MAQTAVAANVPFTVGADHNGLPPTSWYNLRINGVKVLMGNIRVNQGGVVSLVHPGLPAGTYQLVVEACYDGVTPPCLGSDPLTIVIGTPDDPPPPPPPGGAPVAPTGVRIIKPTESEL